MFTADYNFPAFSHRVPQFYDSVTSIRFRIPWNLMARSAATDDSHKSLADKRMESKAKPDHASTFTAQLRDTHTM